MTLRTKSKMCQWAAWLVTGLVALTAYVVLSRLLYGEAVWSPLDLRVQRLILPIAAVLGLIMWETRWDGIVREEKVQKIEPVQSEAKEPRQDEEATVSPEVAPADQPQLAARQKIEVPRQDRQTTNDPRRSPPAPDDGALGEDLYNRARALSHRMIPERDSDSQYLDLLGRSAQKGYAPALAKLGEYAMRRGAWVEAYFWMKQAQRSGMHGLAPTLRMIRTRWVTRGFPSRSSNVSPLFTERVGQIGCALLRVDSGFKASGAREFLRANYPEFLENALER